MLRKAGGEEPSSPGHLLLFRLFPLYRLETLACLFCVKQYRQSDAHTGIPGTCKHALILRAPKRTLYFRTERYNTSTRHHHLL